MVDIHDEAERLGHAWVKEYKRTFPQHTPSQAIATLGERVTKETGWDDVLIVWGRRWLAAKRSAEIARPRDFR